MDFSKFRTTGELSDITVIVEGNDFKLHKFPLYAKSEFFCKLAKNTPSESGRVELTDFPGGDEVFGLVADFCYNMKIETTKDNIVPLRCAAELLQMTGSANLIEVSDKFIQDTITSAKMSRSSSVVASMLRSCVSMSSLAESCGIVSSCSDALVECWLKPPTKFSSPTNSKKQGGDKSIKSLLLIPFDWFLKLFTSARDRGVRHSHLAELMTQFISNIIEQEEKEEKNNNKTESLTSTLSPRDSGSNVGKSKLDIGHIIDSIVLEIPEDALYDDAVTMDWITKVLRIATGHGCACRRLLVKAAGEMLNRLSAEDLCIVSPSLLHDIVLETCNENGQTEKASNIVDTYMSEMVRKGVLTAETYKLLATALPSDAKTNQDHMYTILEYVLSSETDNLNDEQRQELISTIDFKLVTEETLQRALTTNIVPAVHIAQGALSLCSKLRTELESVKRLNQKQDEEIKKYQKHQNSSKSRSSGLSSRKDDSLTLSDLDYLEPTKEKPSSVQMLSDTLNTSKEDSFLSGPRTKISESKSPYQFRSLAAPEHDGTQDDESYQYERGFRNLDNSRSKQRSLGYGYRPTYSYSGRY
ncbi:Hypothetical predicted protein [Mytilus galloprovincialis]|uniref:BTB domain-containing protein n=1 Tax=Mytilus galloprovincialis TaxID=29158 RepID=A0A8B6E325_MYTGA|nr:Hypothetical predicted protein [Mytilus galloprovincialis]